jgi:hypothetical protein
VKVSPQGKVPRATVRRAVSSVHVYPTGDGSYWVVKEIGPVGTNKRFASKDTAVAFANKVASAKHSGVILHPKIARLKVGRADDDSVYEVVF